MNKFIRWLSHSLLTFTLRLMSKHSLPMTEEEQLLARSVASRGDIGGLSADEKSNLATMLRGGPERDMKQAVQEAVHEQRDESMKQRIALLNEAGRLAIMRRDDLEVATLKFLAEIAKQRPALFIYARDLFAQLDDIEAHRGGDHPRAGEFRDLRLDLHEARKAAELQ